MDTQVLWCIKIGCYGHTGLVVHEDRLLWAHMSCVAWSSVLWMHDLCRTKIGCYGLIVLWCMKIGCCGHTGLVVHEDRLIWMHRFCGTLRQVGMDAPFLRCMKIVRFGHTGHVVQ